MINLRCRSEFSFGLVYGPLNKVLAATHEAPAVGIADRSGTWGHPAFQKACLKADKLPILGVELAVVKALEREKLPTNYMAFLARNNAGLKEIYELTTESTGEDNFYYRPRIDYERVSTISSNVIILSGTNPDLNLLPKKKNLFIELAPSTSRPVYNYARENKISIVATSDNHYPTAEDSAIYEIIAGRARDMRTSAMHILNEWEWLNYWPDARGALKTAETLAGECNAVVPSARMVKFKSKKTLEQICRAAAPARHINLKDKTYSDRLRRELDLIEEKDFSDYFFVISDLLQYAKQYMLVGPARGSSGGSLVCYLLSITEIDPIPHGLIFERFIDVNRKDLPDIDIDFPDDRREMVFDYVKNKYGAENVARLGTIMRYKAKSSVDAVARELHIPISDTESFKASIIERTIGDARVSNCLADTFETLDVGREMLEKFPHLWVAAAIEGHARTTGQHAAGIVITEEPINKFCSKNLQNGAIQVDKYDAETINLLKIDALGLRTLSVIQDCLDQIGKTREWLLFLPYTEPEAFRVINENRFAGIFQLEGFAIQNLCQQMKIENFNDIVALGALGRPGPLASGGAHEFVQCRMNRKKVQSLHALCENETRETYGVLLFQEQIMNICRNMGRMTWEDVSLVRKAMSKSFGAEHFEKYWLQFLAGSVAQGATEREAKFVWEKICVFGNYCFNKAHAVAYAVISYWTMYLKALYPLPFAAALLRNSTGEEQVISLLRELDREGFKYKDFDSKTSALNWTIQGDTLVGGLLNVKGIGQSKAQDIIARRAAGKPLTPAMQAKLNAGVTPYHPDIVFEARTRFKDLIKNPERFNVRSKIWKLNEITSPMEGEFLFLGKLLSVSLRDLNEPIHLARRSGERVKGQSLYLICEVSDDSGNILTSVSTRNYLEIGRPLLDSAKVGDWFLWKCWQKAGFRKMYVNRVRKLT